MFTRKTWELIFCSVVSMLAAAIAIFAFESYALERLTGSALDTARFLRALHLVKSEYNGETTDRALFDGAIKGLIDACGDPYTVYLGEEDYRQLTEMTDGSFGGIGIVFGKRGDEYVVISAIPDNPGALAGIKSGDVITAVGGISARELNMEQIAQKIRGEKGTEVVLELKDKSGKLRTVRVIRQEIKNPSVAGRLLAGTKIGYIRIAVFNEATGQDFEDVYRKLEKEGMAATILDLRSNPGGLFTSGVKVAGLLVPKGEIVSVVDKRGARHTEMSKLEQVKYPLAVLVDHGSASASEIVAGAIKDTGSGRLIGVKTFGKGSVQSVYRLDGETAVKITTAKYYTPSGISIHNVGIEPDETVELVDGATGDAQLEAARKYLEGRLKELAGKEAEAARQAKP